MQLGKLRRAPTPLAGHDLEGFRAMRANQYRLQNALFPDGIRKLLQLLGRETLARLERVRLQPVERHRPLPARAVLWSRRDGGFFADQCRKTSPEAAVPALVRTPSFAGGH